MQIQQIVLGMYATNCFIVSGNVPEKCIIIDPADHADKIIEILEQSKLVPEAILLTHGHYDHFLAVPGLQKKWHDLPVYCHPLDCPKEKEEHDMGQVFPTVTAFDNVEPLADNEQLSLAGFTIKVIHTPGHTRGSVTFMIEDVLFTGDTLFKGSIGRTDFEGSDEVEMMQSLQRLGTIEGSYGVCPGHEDTTTLEDEKRYNPYLKAVTKKK